MFGGSYSGRRVLVTGHTGFKGSWLSLWLTRVGASVTGVSLSLGDGLSHYNCLGIDLDSRLHDIRDGEAVAQVFCETKPEIVFHLAAQPLVLRSYATPSETFSINVQGLVSVLEACRASESVRAIVVVTSDKCYENRDGDRAFRESDALGGRDPYSASKAAAEIVAHSYRRSFFAEGQSLRLATARAGNVIGGGDWAADRLLPDMARAATCSQPLTLRRPLAVRPWQHVLDCISGYLRLGQQLFNGDNSEPGAWNFGPDLEACRTVREIVEEASRHWKSITWIEEPKGPHECTCLKLDASRARDLLDWEPVWDWKRAVAETVNWYSEHANGRVITDDQLTAYLDDARRADAKWL